MDVAGGPSQFCTKISCTILAQGMPASERKTLCLTLFCKSLKWTFLVPLDPDGRPKAFRVMLTYSDLCSSLLLNDLPVNCTGNEANAVTVSASPDAD